MIPLNSRMNFVKPESLRELLLVLHVWMPFYMKNMLTLIFLNTDVNKNLTAKY